MTKLELPYSDKILPEIEKEFYKYFETAKDVWDLLLLFMNANSIVGVGKKGSLNCCLVGVYVKMIRLYSSIFVLCKEGLANESCILLRSLFELYVNLAALKKSINPDEFARLWLLWDLHRTCFTCQEIIVRNKIGNLVNEFRDILKDEENKLGPRNWKKFRQYGPSMMPFKELCEKLGFKDSYNTLFRFSSQVVHNSDLGYYAYDTNGGIMCQLIPSKEHIDSVILTMLFFLRDGVEILNELLSLGKEKELEKLKGIVNDFISSNRPQKKFE